MLRITAEAADVREVVADVLVVPVFKGGIEGPGVGVVLDALGLDDFPVTPQFRGDSGQTLLLAAPGLAVGAVLFVGLGRMDATDDERLRQAAGCAARAVGKARRVATTLAQVHAAPSAVEAVAEGFHLGAHSDRRFRSKPDQEAARLREVVVLALSSRLSEARLAVRRAEITARATLAARELVNLPPAQKRPPVLAEHLVALTADTCQTRVRDEQELAVDGFGGILAVGAGSSAPPRLVEIRYRPASPLGHVVLAGKGITFDSGGLNLKRGRGMNEMKSDMAGAAAVAATMSALDDLGVRVEVTALLPLAENMPSGSAQRPQDVIRIHGGTTVEVLDTDAEGRLVLADVLDYAAALHPEAIVDLATLTGSAITALGRYAAGLMGNDTELVEALRAAAVLAGEDVWPLPLWSRLQRWLESPVADLNNTGDGAGGGTITAGLFLQHFVGDTSWAHLDIAGPAFLPPDLATGYLPAGGTGFGVRTLLAWLEHRTG